MSNLKGKIDFVALVSATNANPNGDPLNGNRPRENFDGYGEISDVCIKRKIRNRLRTMAMTVFMIEQKPVQSSKKRCLRAKRLIKQLYLK